ncbi:MAG TPA: LLM class flavin-dependent oxidoreductase [Micromonosporaceae bacterium]
MQLSVLDLMTVRTGQTTADSLAATLRLAQKADELGYHRYWVAEHHNMPSVGSTNPPVLIAMIASHTSRIRVGSGGVMLPNHPPLIIAEQFALLEAFAPGRIDLGIGRAPGSDPVVSAVLNRGDQGPVDDFPNNVQAVARMMGPAGATVLLADDKTYELRATPAATTTPEIWLLGSSDYSATLAAALGLPYVFASHFFAGSGTERALDLYRSGFRPSEALAEPRILVTANVVAAETEDEAQALARPQLQRMAFMRTGRPMLPMATVEEAAETPTSPMEEQIIDDMRQAWIIGDAKQAIDRLHGFAERLGADEVMIAPAGSAHLGEDPRRYLARERTLELVAGA